MIAFMGYDEYVSFWGGAVLRVATTCYGVPPVTSPDENAQTGETYVVIRLDVGITVLLK